MSRTVHIHDHLARQDAELRIITEALRERHALMQQTA